MIKHKSRLLILLLLFLLLAAVLHLYLRGRFRFTSTSNSLSDGQQLQDTSDSDENKESADFKNKSECEKWGVVAPTDTNWTSEAIRRHVRMYDWCLVIVFEREPARTYDARWFSGEGNTAVVILTPENAKNTLGDSEFVKAVAWDQIGRKNIGYYYAITHGANIIWDFDDYNMLKFWIRGAAPPEAPSLEASIPSSETVNVLEPEDHNWTTWNPYPAMGAPDLESWPRGLPVDEAVNKDSSNARLKETTVSRQSIAVLQSLSDRQPDADELYQTLMPFPFYFNRKPMKTVMVPKHSLTPYNSRATLHFQQSLWALFLPSSVDSNLSDIWRSYIGQRLFWEAGLRVGIIGRPLVVQDRNIHISMNKTTVKKMYTKIKDLISMLRSWRGTAKTLAERVNELWFSLGENKLASRKDVKLMQLWMESLSSVGYKFPELTGESVSYPKYKTSVDLIDFSVEKLYPETVESERYTVKRNAPEYDDQDCNMKTTPQSLTFWNSDIHFASRLDQPTFVGELGHRVILALGQQGGYRNPFVWSLKGIHLYDRVSDVLRKYFSHVSHQNRAITEEMIKENFEFYKNDPEMANVDAFICLFQPGMCEMWMPFNKTTVFIPAHRYNMGRCSIEETKRLNEHLYTLARMDNPKHVISSTSKYDLEYLRHYTDLEVLPLYSYCIYVAKNMYAPSRDEIPIFVRKVIYHNWDNRFTTDIKKVKVVDIEKLYKFYSFSDLVRHRAVVFLAYATMTYKVTELYTLGIPLFVPSMNYYRNIKSFGPDRTILAKEQWCGLAKGTLKDSEMIPHPNSIHPYSPNAVDEESEFYWLQLADFVQWPHITYFDDFKDLEEKLLSADFNRIHALMVKENERRRKQLENNWCKVFKKIDKGRKVPQDYVSAINTLFNVSKLQVN